MGADLAQIRKRINIELPGIVIEKLDNLARKVDSSRSEIIRTLISDSLAEKEQKELELSMKEGYGANYEFIEKSSKEWDFASGDGL